MKTILLIFAFVVVSACGSIAKVTYYSPEPHEDIKILSSTRGPSDVVKLVPAENIEMNIIIFEHKNYSTIRYYFNLPSGRTIKFIDKGFKIKSNNKVIEANIESIQANYIVNGVGSSKHFKVSDILIGDSQNIKTPYGSNAIINRPFTIDIKLNEKPPEEFKLYFPKFMLSGNKINIKPIIYKRMIGEFYQVRTP